MIAHFSVLPLLPSVLVLAGAGFISRHMEWMAVEGHPPGPLSHRLSGVMLEIDDKVTTGRWTARALASLAARVPHV